MTDYSVEADGLTKYFDSFKAVDHVSLQAREGSIYGVLGPNGAGKTTSLRMTLGIIDPDEGTSRLLGGHKPQSVRHRIGYLPEERGLYPGMKAREAIGRFKYLPNDRVEKGFDEVERQLNAEISELHRKLEEEK